MCPLRYSCHVRKSREKNRQMYLMMAVAKAAAAAQTTKAAFVICQFGRKKASNEPFVFSFIHSLWTPYQFQLNYCLFIFMFSTQMVDSFLLFAPWRRNEINFVHAFVSQVTNFCDIFLFCWACDICINHVLIPQMLLKSFNEFNS